MAASSKKLSPKREGGTRQHDSPFMKPTHSILILEDNESRIEAFRKAVEELGPTYSLHLWHDAPTMMSECPLCFADACLISLDHDLAPIPDATFDPGDGLQVAEFLCNTPPICPVIIHTSNDQRRWSMYNAFRFAKWNVHVIAPLGSNWIRDSWSRLARELLKSG